MAIYSAHAKLNAIRAAATNAYQTTVPLATIDNIKDVGKAVLTAPQTVQNEFYAGIVNLIGMQMINVMAFTNPLTSLKKGTMEYGMTIEDIYVEMASAHEYVSGTRSGESAPDPFAITKASVKAAFYHTQLERQYKVTIHQQDVRRAFLSADPVGTLTSALMQSLRSAEEYDDYRMTVALMARQIEAAETDVSTKWNGQINLITDFNALFRAGDDDVALTADTALYDKDFLTYMVEQIKMWSNRLAYPRSDLNVAGVINSLPKERQDMIMLGDIDSKLTSYLTPWAYNKADLSIGNFLPIDAWYSIGADDTTPPTAQSISPDDIVVKGELGGAGPVVAVLYDREMPKIYNKVNITDSAHNGAGHYDNIFRTVADIYAASPFRNFIAFYLA